jgi:hypothetical protein
MEKKDPRKVEVTIEQAASALKEGYGGRARARAEELMLEARREKKDDHDRFWQAVERILSFEEVKVDTTPA